MRPVNLLPDARHDAGNRAARHARKQRVAAFVVVGVLLLAAVVLSAEYVRAHSEVSDSRTALGAAQKELAEIQAEAAAPSAAETALEARLAAGAAGPSGRRGGGPPPGGPAGRRP